MAEDISRRIDDLLSGAIDEQVREQRVLNDMLVGVRDGVSRLVGDVAALSARVTESRETSQGLREELPFLVQREVGSAVNAMSVRIDVLETAIGELVASLAGLEDRVGPEVIVGGVAERLDAMRASEEGEAGRVTAEAAAAAIEDAAAELRAVFEAEAVSSRAVFDQAALTMSDAVEKQHTQVSRRLAEVKKWSDQIESRMKSLEKALEASVKMPVEVRQQLNELTGATQDMTDSILEEIRINTDAAASRLGASVEGVDAQAVDMSRRFAEMTDQVRAFREELLAYLQVRDVALEERRDQIVTELLGDFLGELPARERDRAAGKLRTVFARRRDRRDAARYRTAGPGPGLPRTSQDAVARAQAEIDRERHPVPERAWSERAWSDESLAPEPPAPAPITREEPAGPDGGTAAPASAKPASKARKPGAAAKPAARKPAARKPAARKPGKKKAEPSAIPDALGEPADLLVAEDARAAEGEMEAFDIQAAFASIEGETEPAAPRKARSKAKPAATSRAKKQPGKTAAPAEAEAAETPAPAEAEAGETPAPDEGTPEPGDGAEHEQGDDTLQQALQRVQALVDSHRKPGAARRRTR